jgi:hypothetical protein
MHPIVVYGNKASNGTLVPLNVDDSGQLKIAGSFSADPPVGGATEAKQDALIALLPAALDNGRVKVALPAGGSGLTDTELRASAVDVNPTDRALRDMGKTDVASFDQYTPKDVDTGAGSDNALPVALMLPASGGGAMAPGDATNGLKVQLPAATVSTLTPPAAITNFANETGGNLAAIKAKTDNIPALGQALAAASVPVVLTAAQMSTLTPPAAITGFATSAKQDTGNTSIASVDTKTGEVQATPTANTVLARLKDLLTGIVLAAGTNLIGNVGHGKTIKTYSATISADTDIVAAVTSKRIKVIAYSITTNITTEQLVIFKSNGTGGTELWRVDLQAISGGVMGANLATSAPSFLFGTVAGEKLTADVSAATAIHISIAYFDDDAS